MFKDRGETAVNFVLLVFSAEIDRCAGFGE
jgi:hypothetical protein